jgi:predicted GNAT family acetyltransferase
MFEYQKDCIVLKNETGKPMGKVEFATISDNVIDIQHTLVEPDFRGQGIAGKLITEMAKWLITNKKQGILTCSYAVRWFSEHPEYDHLVFKAKD